MTKKQFFSTSELADICQVDSSTIFRAIVNKFIKAATTPGGHYRISRSEAENFLRKNNIPFPATETRPARILIVEDNPAELRLYKRVLAKGGGFEVKTTLSGYEAGFLTQYFKPDLILLDIFLCDIDGRQVAKLIRSDPQLKHVKIVAITGAKNPKDIREITASHFDAFIFKPINPDELRKRVERLLT